jgi:hypothetical protein
LQQYRPVCEGLNVDAFVAQFDTCFADVAASEEQFPTIVLNPELIPEIWLDPPVELPPVEIEG